MATVLITGGTGMIGTALTKELTRKNYQVIVLTRKAKLSTENITYKEWDVEKGEIDEAAISDADYIVHLAGANVGGGRWTKKRRKEIIDSRVKSGELLVKSLKNVRNKVRAVISASAIGWYGPDKPRSKPFVETDAVDNSFLGRVCQMWEAAIEPVKELGKRLVIFRTGIVLSNEGGAYPEFKKPLKFRVATILGSGKQIVSWIHIDDIVRLYIEAIEKENLQGIYNAVVPHPVSNSHLMQTIGAFAGKKYICVHVPEAALKIALGEMSVEVLKSTTVSSAKIEATGFQFAYPTINAAVEKLTAS